MNIASAKQQVKDTVEAYLEMDEAGVYRLGPAHQRPVFLLGAPGIGKTAIMEQVARELGIGLVSYSMTHHTRQSALGLPRIEHRSFEGMEFEASEYTMSEIVAAIYDYMERTDLRRGILFLDEINCVSETLYPSMLQFLQFKTFGKHKVPEGWVVVCAGNPPEYNRSVHEFDIVTLDRLREIDVEPDYAAWRAYATEAGLHSAVTTFLEAKKDCFYKVESRPGGGKAFVTARGWEDLARVIALYEGLGKPVDRELVAQFLRDADVADQFAVYYALFQKYRSDYQVDAILSGEAGEAIKERARQAAFDERLALLGLLLDAVAGDCADVLEREEVALALRDVLREAKPELLEGAAAEVALGGRIAAREAALGRKVASGTASDAVVRKERLALAALRDLAARCALERALEGPEAFAVVERAYKELVGALGPAVEAASARMDGAFGFVEECLGSREMLVLVAELSTRRATTQFIARHGNERYYARNEELQVDAARTDLGERAALLEELDEGLEPKEASGPTAASGLRAAAAPGAPCPAPGGSAAAGDAAAPAASASATPELIARALLQDNYDGKQFEYGFAGVCKMMLPVSDLKGKKVLDVCCRRGMGVYKLSAMVGDRGEAVGVDWSAAYIQEAKDGMGRAWRDSGLKANNMDFRVAYPEDLVSAGIGSGTMDAVYVNNVVTLFCDQAQALREFSRVLRPGGLLILETVFADRPRDEAVVEAARAMGNSIQAARTEEENRAWLRAAGFAKPFLEDSYEVAADRGYRPEQKVAVAPGDEDVRYQAVCLYVHKR